MKWIKIYPIEWLHSTCRDELLPAERATFQDYICLASLRDPLGEFRYISDESLARQLNTPAEVIKNTNLKCINSHRIFITKNEEDYTLKVLNYFKYQTLRPVNKKHKKNKKLLTKSHLRGRDREDTDTEKRIKDPRIKSILDFFFSYIEKEKGFKPIIGSADAKAVQRALKLLGSEEKVREAIQYYLNSQKAQEHGVTLKIALSEHSLNLFLEEGQEW